MPFKGIFRRFDGFSAGGWYKVPPSYFYRLKSPENGLNAVCIFVLF